MIATQKDSVPAYIQCRLSPDEWKEKRSEHRQLIAGMLDDYLEKRSRQQKDPVMDFLFEYYAFRPSHLRRWSPGVGTLLINGGQVDWSFNEMATIGKDCLLDITHFSADRISSLKWILNVLKKSADRKPSFGCFGMHEWAMVYKANHVRHDYLSLRMEMDELAEFVESRPLLCTHFDAFRFFTEDAKPQNKFELNRGKFPEMEQAGCLHTNMDLYKWSFKMYPWISGDTLRRAFKLAVETRVIDMKASPYDLRHRGLEPIRIETKEGREEYIKEQKAIFEKAKPIRKELIKEYEQMLDIAEQADLK
jgi:hypothetical protein